MKINSPLLWKALFGMLSMAGSALMVPAVQHFVSGALAAGLKGHPFLSELAVIAFSYLALLTHNK